MRVESHRKGFALLAAMGLTALGAAGVAGYLLYCANSAHAIRRTIDYQKAKLAAEAGLDYGIRKLRDVILAYQFELTQSELQYLLDQIPPPPPLGEYDYRTGGGEAAFRIRADGGPQQGMIVQGTACRGQEGQYQYFTVTCGAINTNSGVGAVLQENLQAVSVYMIRFGVFYENDLEILPGPEMVFEGPVHGNHDLYLDSGSRVTFRDRVTAHGDIYNRRKDQDRNYGNAYIENAAGVPVCMVQNGRIVDSTHSNWMTEAVKLWDGRVLSGAHGVPELSPPINPVDEPHDIIERPVPAGSPGYNAETEAEKFANKAGLIIYVDGAGNFWATNSFGEDVTSRFTNAALVVSGYYNGKPLYAKNSDYTYRMATNGAYDLSQTNFWDRRENARMAVLDIYIDQLVASYPELFSGTVFTVEDGRGIIYVTRDDPDGPGGVIPAVRLRNGRDLPDGGLTIASDLPVYVEGDYNVADDPHTPSLVAGDAVTFLSRDWQDARSADNNCENRVARSTTYYTVIMTGNQETTPGQYNGGLENVLRFLEKWSGKTVTYRGAIIDIWYSEVVTGAWHYGQYYKAPRRNWGYDEIYRTDAPPGMPRVFGLEELCWRPAGWDEFAE